MWGSQMKREFSLYAMILMPAIVVLVFGYIPMFGIVMAFQDFVPTSHGYIYSLIHYKFVGLDVFRTIWISPDAKSVIVNTFFIAGMKIIVKLVVPLVFALLLNEVTKGWFRKLGTTITYLPFFLSWVVVGGVLLDFFSPQDGAFNHVLAIMGLSHETFFFGTASQFPYAVVISDL